MAVKPDEIPVEGEEVAGESPPVEEGVAPSDEPSAPELAEGAVVPLEEFQRLEQNVARLQSTLDARAAEAERRAEEAEERAGLAIRKAQEQFNDMVRNAEAHAASLDEEERERYLRGLEAWKAAEEADLAKLREKINVPARERRKVAQQYEIPVEELGDIEDSVEMRDVAFKVRRRLKAEKKPEPKPEKEPRPEARKEQTIVTRGALQPPGGAPTPKKPPRVTQDMIREAGARGDMEKVAELQEQLKAQRSEDEKASGVRR